MFCAKFLARKRGMYNFCQGMCNKCTRDPVAREELLLEGEDTEKAINGCFQCLNAPAPPGPSLWSDQIDHGDAFAAQKFCQAQIEIRRVGQYGDVRPLGYDGFF